MEALQIKTSDDGDCDMCDLFIEEREGYQRCLIELEDNTNPYRIIPGSECPKSGRYTYEPE